MARLTIKDVAREAGVSTATISRVLNHSGYVQEDVRKHVFGVVERLNYRPNAIARSLKQDKSSGVGIVLPDMTNPYFMQIARAIQNRCMAEGYHIMFMDTEESAGKEREALNFLAEQRVEALILAGTGGNLEQIDRMRSLGTHVVLFDRCLPGLHVDSVMENNRDVSALAVSGLMERGHTRVGIIRGPQTLSTAVERFEGVKAGLESRGMRIREKDVFSGDYSRQSGMAAAAFFAELPDAPTAIFSSNNEMTFGLYLELQRRGIPLNRFEVVSFGDLEFTSLFDHKLTVIRQKPAEIGEAIGDIVVKRLAGAAGPVEQRVFDPVMVSARS